MNRTLLAGDDGLWVDPQTLHKGDVFQQQHWFSLDEGEKPHMVIFGLYDPKTGARLLTREGQDHVALPIDESQALLMTRDQP